MKSMRIIRLYPKDTHISTSRHASPKVCKKLKMILTLKTKHFQYHHLPMHSRMGIKRREYYHDNRYDDPWGNTDDSLVQYQGVPSGNGTHIHRDKDLQAYLGKLEIKRWNSTCVATNVRNNEIPVLTENKHIKSKMLYPIKYTKKKELIHCRYESLNYAIYRLLHDNM